MISVDNQVDNTVKIMYENIKRQMNQHELHMQLNNIFNDQSAKAVVSVYVDEQPAHKVLQDLENWAASIGNVEVLKKIKELKNI